MRKNGKVLATMTLVAVSATLLLGGCSSQPENVSPSWVRSNLTPELQSIAHSPEQRKNVHARVYDTNLRQVWDDLDMILLLDRPSQMSKYPIP